MLTALTFLVAAHAAPTLDITGTCPGPATIDITGVTPGGDIALLHGISAGSDVIPSGACAGLSSGLAGIRWAGNTTDADGDGAFLFAPSLGGAACARWVQVLDTTTCELSPVVELGAITEGGGGGPITPGDTSAVVTFLGGDVFDPDLPGSDSFGELNFRCAEWEGDVCVNPQNMVEDSTCGAYPNANTWHRNLFVNSSQERNCRLFCLATTGSEDWNVCEGGAANSDAYWAYSYSQRGTQCDAEYIWRTQDVTAQCDPYCLNIKLGTGYAGSPNLRLECAGW